MTRREHFSPQNGWIEVICGPMFSGKSEELIRRLRRAHLARRSVLAVKPGLDDRYEIAAIASHNRQTFACHGVTDPTDVLNLLQPDTEVVGIDEVQFLGLGIVPIIEQLAANGLRVICAGLDQDYRAEPWHPMPELLARAEVVDKLQAICVVCGHPATRTQRLVSGGDRVMIGGVDTYEARCRGCHYIPDESTQQLELGVD